MSNPIDQELLPCPFCGDPNPNLTHDDYIHEDGQPMAVVECTKCHTWVQAEAWNKRATVQPAGVAVPSTAEYGEAVKRLFELDADAKKYCAEHWLLTIFKWTVGRVCEINSVAVQHLVSGEQKADQLRVWEGSMPESNGKTNYTAILHKGDISEGMTIACSEYPDRVRYEADEVRWLIGERAERPDILDYDAEKHSGYTPPPKPVAQDVAGLVKALEACRNELLHMIDKHNVRDESDGSWLYDYQTVYEADAALADHRDQQGQ